MSKNFSLPLKSFLGKKDAYVSNGLLFPASQAQTPSPMSIQNTDASGIYFPTFVSATGNTTTFNVDISGFVYDASNNRLGINKTSPAYNLDVSGTANITGNLSVDTNTLFVNASNNRVGVGTSNPAYPLDVVGDAKFTAIRDAENSIGTNGQVLVSNGSALVWNDNRVDVNNTPNSATYHYLTFCDNNTTSQRIQIDKDALTYQPSTNNLGIGTLTPAFNLDVSGTANITGNLSVDTNTLFVDASNNFVGIGKTNPQTTLDISGNLLVSRNVLGQNAPLFVDVSNNRVGIAMRAQNPQAPLHVQSDNNNSTQVIISGGGSHSHTNRGLRIATYETSSYDAGVNLDAQFPSGELTFSTAGNSRMTIRNNGNVGINKTAPDYKLHVEGSGTADEVVGWFNNQATYSSSIAVRHSSKTAYISNHYGLGTPNYDGQVSNAISFGVASGASPIQFYNGNTGVGSRGTARLTILTDGKIGIGTNTPSEKLNIDGGNLLMNGTFDGMLMTASLGGSLAITRGGTFTNNVQQINAPYTDNIGGSSGGGAQISLLKNEMTFSTFPNTGTLGNPITLTERMRLTATGLGIATTSPTNLLDVNGNSIRLRTARTPASASATGTTGEICWDSSYIYVCVNTNTWKRVAISTW